ncbi:MAG TPA: S8 family serine peptidase [Chloroflexia bacterium]|nr:S8 family serine peptidase [Chloroflexia bacterium]
MNRIRTPDTMFFIVETETGSKDERERVEKAFNDALGRDARGRKWLVEPLFPRSAGRPTRLARYLRVNGSVEGPPQQWDKIAFQLAYHLSDATGFKVRPDLPSSHFASPDVPALPPDRVDPDSPRLASGPGSPGGRLPGAASKSWALEAIRVPQAWTLPLPPGGKSQGEGVVVAHPDTGYTRHPNLNLVNFDLGRDRDILDNDADALDPLEQFSFFGLELLQPGHGTTSASVLAGEMVQGIKGSAPRAKIVPLRAMKSVWHVFDSDIARAVDYARFIKADVISMSLGGEWFDALEEAIEDAIAEGIIVVAAAGNGVGFVVAPASYPACIALGASNADSKTWVGGSRGPKVAICAPGQDVWAAGYKFQGGKPPELEVKPRHGTTFAAALTAGVAALWLAHYGRKRLTDLYGKGGLQAAFLHALTTKGFTKPDGWDTSNFGVGLVNAEALLSGDPPDPAVVFAASGPDLASGADVAGGAGSRAASAQPFVPKSIVALFPELDRNELRKRLERMLKSKGDTLDAKLRRYEVELVRMFTERRAVWEAFMRDEAQISDAPMLASGGPTRGTLGQSLIAQFASPMLLAEIAEV